MSRITPIRAISLTLGLALAVVIVFWLPPRQTADAVAIAAVVAAHLAATWLLEWLMRSGNGVYSTVGIAVVTVIYWLAAVGCALLWMLLRLTDGLLLAALELIAAAIAALLCYLFVLVGRRNDDSPETSGEIDDAQTGR